MKPVKQNHWNSYDFLCEKCTISKTDLSSLIHVTCLHYLIVEQSNQIFLKAKVK